MAIIPIKNFNRIIDLRLTKKTKYNSTGLLGSQNFFIRCPRTGRKPDIRISGQILPSDLVSVFEIRIKNLYDTSIVADLSEIQVTAGYEASASAVFSGTPENVYTSGPGPDRETVIQCTTATFSTWTDTILKLQLPRGFTLRDAVTQINTALRFAEPQVDPAAALMTSTVAWDYSGSAKEALHILISKFFPSCSAFVMNNRITVKNEEAAAVGKVYELPFLSSAPQFSGGQITLTAPWNPAIKPKDRVKFSSAFYTSDLSELIGIKLKETSIIEVVQIAFEFSTVGGTNSMTIQGTLVGGL